jgi:hypothetical protein
MRKLSHGKAFFKQLNTQVAINPSFILRLFTHILGKFSQTFRKFGNNGNS